MDTILLVEDDTILREVLQDSLSDLGHSCLAVGTLERAQQVLQEHHWDLVITDVNLSPGAQKEGLEIARWLKDHAAHTRVVLMSGSERSEMERSAAALGALFLPKPFEVDAMIRVCFPPPAAPDPPDPPDEG